MIAMGFGVGESGIGARAESDADFGAGPVIRVLEFVAPMVYPGFFIARQVSNLSSGDKLETCPACSLGHLKSHTKSSFFVVTTSRDPDEM